MGTWGPGVFDDDVALDVQDIFDAALSEGVDVPVATQRVLQALNESLDDPDDEAVICLALASLQMDREALQPEVRKRAIQIIEMGDGFRRWAEADEHTQAERLQVLDTLRLKLVDT